MPSLSIVIPVFNRVELLVHPLTSLRSAAIAAGPDFRWEIIVIDDGSTEDVAAVLAPFSDLPLSVFRQSNAGLLAARLAGLARASHETILFLDADDLIAPGKFTQQLPALDGNDVAYGDVSRTFLTATGEPQRLRHDLPLGESTESADFYLRLQPGPHNPIFRRTYLRDAIAQPLFPPHRAYDSIAETWLYYQLSVIPARIRYVPGPWTIVGEHGRDRLSRSWERQANGALRLMKNFMRHCPNTHATQAARRRVGVCAFATWRALPHSFHGFPADDFLAIWRSAPRGPMGELGHRGFRRIAAVLGPERAARSLKRFQRPPYAKIRTLDSVQLAALVND